MRILVVKVKIWWKKISYNWPQCKIPLENVGSISTKLVPKSLQKWPPPKWLPKAARAWKLVTVILTVIFAVIFAGFGRNFGRNFVEMDSTFSKGILRCGKLWEMFFHQIFTLTTNISSGNESIIMILTPLKDTSKTIFDTNIPQLLLTLQAFGKGRT